MHKDLKAIASDIVRFKRTHNHLKNLKDNEFVYNYLVWALTRHIDFSLDRFRSCDELFQIDYWTLYLLYDELCEIAGLQNKIGFMCINSISLRYISKKLNLGDLYIFYVEYLDTNDKFSIIALDLIKLSK